MNSPFSSSSISSSDRVAGIEPLLGSSNYAFGKRIMTSYLTARQVWLVISGELTCPDIQCTSPPMLAAEETQEWSQSIESELSRPYIRGYTLEGVIPGLSFSHHPRVTNQLSIHLLVLNYAHLSLKLSLAHLT